MDLFDAHAHMVADDFAADLDHVLKEAAAHGVKTILTVSETLQEAETNLRLAEKYPMLKPAAGLYPTILDREAAGAMVAFINTHAGRLVAIGEVGLDYWIIKEEAERETQRHILAQFIALSHKFGLPLNIHSRAAGRHAIEFLRDHGAQHVLLHAFDGKASSALAGVEVGYYFSIPPSIVRSPQKQKLVRRLPLDHLLLESDSPVLGPDPRVRNEPKNISIACQAIAQLKGISAAEVAEITTTNARRLFPRAFA